MSGEQGGVLRVRGLFPLTIAEVIRETAEASSFTLQVPDHLTEKYVYRAGQFLTVRVELDGVEHVRSYSMSSAPSVDDRMRVTVKRVPGGVVSNWMNDVLAPGDEIMTSVPAGTFVVGADIGEVVAFAGGSGIAPVLSIVKSVLAESSRRVRLLYANRDDASVIFCAELAALSARHGSRLKVAFHLDSDSGVLDRDAVGAFLGEPADGEFFVCGPEPFMSCVQEVLAGRGIEPGRVRVERFTPATAAEGDPDPGAEERVNVTIRLGRRSTSGEMRRGSTLLQAARSLGLRPPSSCETGSCATCMAQVVDGAAVMRANEALTPEEVADGWVLTCQALPAGPSISVVYA